MDIRKIRKLIEIMEESNIGELEIHEGEESIRLTRANKDSLPFSSSNDQLSETEAS